MTCGVAQTCGCLMMTTGGNEFLTPTSLYPHCLDIPFLAVSVEIPGELDFLRGKKGLGRS